jgi:hypothetical protein
VFTLWIEQSRFHCDNVDGMQKDQSNDGRVGRVVNTDVPPGAGRKEMQAVK